MFLCVTLATLLDLALFFSFHWKFHPWVDIVKKENIGEVAEILQNTKEVILKDSPAQKIKAAEKDVG